MVFGRGAGLLAGAVVVAFIVLVGPSTPSGGLFGGSPPPTPSGMPYRTGS